MSAECNKWTLMTEMPPELRDGRDVIVGWDVATVWMVRNAHYDDGSQWEFQGSGSRDEASGWWSYVNSVFQDKLEGTHEPTHYLEMPEVPTRGEN